MQLKYLLLLILTVFGTVLFGQSNEVFCDLGNLYQLTRSKSPTLQRQQILNRRAEVGKQFAASLFDYRLSSDFTLSRLGQNLFDADPRVGIVGNQIQTNNLGLSANLGRTFRTGLSANVGIDYSRIGDNFPLNSFNENIGYFVSNNNTYTSVSVRQPLLRGRGRDIATANEKIADISVEGQQLNANFITSSEVFGMSVGYWQYLAASQSLEIYRGNTARVRQVLEITNELVKASRKPTSDLVQIQADLKDKEQQEVQAVQQLYATQQNLGRSVGLTAVESERIGQPVNDFPKLEDLNLAISLEQLIEIAHQHRTDLKSLKKSLEIAAVSLEVAENNMKPQLDATAFVGYGGVDIGNGINRVITPLFQNQGRNYQAGVGISYLFPLNNNQAEANLLENELLYNDQQVLIRDQIRNIELNVSIAYNNYRNSVEALQKSKQSLDYYTEVFENEQVKFQSGLTTLLNLILFQERLTFAQLNYVQNQQQFATAISNLRFETGTLLPQNQGVENTNYSIDIDTFYSLPQR